MPLGAENGARTRDLNLGKVALYQLSYFRKTLLLSVGIAKIDTFFETAKKIKFFSMFFADKMSVAQHLSAALQQRPTNGPTITLWRTASTNS